MPLDTIAAGCELCMDRAGVARDRLGFVSCHTVPPFLEIYAHEWAERLQDADWVKGFCPVCGSEPLMGRLDKEAGKRLLQCYLCRAEWAFKRLECPFCGSSVQEKLRYFSDEKDPSRRVEVCDVCRKYLKTVDTREMKKECTLFVENLATIHLDMVARDEGFERETNRLFGL